MGKIRARSDYAERVSPVGEERVRKDMAAPEGEGKEHLPWAQEAWTPSSWYWFVCGTLGAVCSEGRRLDGKHGAAALKGAGVPGIFLTWSQEYS